MATSLITVSPALIKVSTDLKNRRPSGAAIAEFRIWQFTVNVVLPSLVTELSTMSGVGSESTTSLPLPPT